MTPTAHFYHQHRKTKKEETRFKKEETTRFKTNGREFDSIGKTTTAANIAQPTTKKPSGHFGSIP